MLTAPTMVTFALSLAILELNSIGSFEFVAAVIRILSNPIPPVKFFKIEPIFSSFLLKHLKPRLVALAIASSSISMPIALHPDALIICKVICPMRPKPITAIFSPILTDEVPTP